MYVHAEFFGHISTFCLGYMLKEGQKSPNYVFGYNGLQKILIWHQKKTLRVMKFFWGITNSPLKEFWPMVHTSLLYYGNATSSKTIFGLIFFHFLTFVQNFGHLKCSDLEEILHGSSAWCEVPPIKILSKSVNIKGGNDIIFLDPYSEKTCFFQI